jgi:peptide/nickel transport system ATP-binding protein
MLEISELSKSFHVAGKGRVQALDDVTLKLADSEILGLVGESGCGKSTLLRCVMRLTKPDQGRITYDGTDVHRARRGDVTRFRREVQMVFQDPYASLNPRMTVEQLITEGMVIHALVKGDAARRDEAARLIDMVGLSSDALEKYPRSFSGGQRQRIAIARALAVRPRVLVCDEPVSALDVSIQAQVLNLLIDMQAELGLAILFVAHNLAVVRQLCPRVAVMSEGRIVEQGTRDAIFHEPQHPYTRELLSAVPVPSIRAQSGTDRSVV